MELTLKMPYNVYRDTQAFICKDSGLLKAVMDRFGNGDLQFNLFRYINSDVNGFRFNPRHSSVVGNLVLIAHVRNLSK